MRHEAVKSLDALKLSGEDAKPVDDHRNYHRNDFSGIKPKLIVLNYKTAWHSFDKLTYGVRTSGREECSLAMCTS